MNIVTRSTQSPSAKDRLDNWQLGTYRQLRDKERCDEMAVRAEAKNQNNNNEIQVQ